MSMTEVELELATWEALLEEVGSARGLEELCEWMSTGTTREWIGALSARRIVRIVAVVETLS